MSANSPKWEKNIKIHVFVYFVSFKKSNNLKYSMWKNIFKICLFTVGWSGVDFASIYKKSLGEKTNS